MENKAKIIHLIDDKIGNLKLAVSILQKEGYEIAISKTGAEALENVEEINPDLILLDIMMPDIDGYEVCRRFKVNPKIKDIPVVFLTAKHTSKDLVEGFRAGGVDYVKKPFEIDELLSRVSAHIQLKTAKDELARANSELQKLNSSLTKAVEEKNALLQISAHDLKNPLTSALSIIEIFERNDDIPREKRVDLLKTARFSLETAARITNDLVELQKFEEEDIKLKTSPFDAVESAKNILERYSIRLKTKNIKSSIIAPPSLIVFSDKIKFERVLDNLVSNAVKFTKLGGEICVKIDFIEKGDDAAIYAEVIDQGPGLTEHDRSRLFKKFEKLSAKPTGGETSTGLGLSIAKFLAKALDGDLRVESKLGEGSTFIAEIPVKRN